MTDIDLRSHFPELKRSVQLPDGEDYFIRELIDLPIGTFNRIISDEKNFAGMKFLERHAIERQHLQALLVAMVTTRGVAAKGDRRLRLAGDGSLDLQPGDVVHSTGGLYFERNVVDSVSDDGGTAVMQNAWRFDASEGARVYRSVRSEVIDLLTIAEFGKVIGQAKAPDPGDSEGGSENPPTAASGSTS